MTANQQLIKTITNKGLKGHVHSFSEEAPKEGRRYDFGKTLATQGLYNPFTLFHLEQLDEFKICHFEELLYSYEDRTTIKLCIKILSDLVRSPGEESVQLHTKNLMNLFKIRSSQVVTRGVSLLEKDGVIKKKKSYEYWVNPLYIRGSINKDKYRIYLRDNRPELYLKLFS